MSLRVVLYSEGGREDAGESSIRLAPGARLTEDWLGPAHVLIRRSLERVKNIPEGAVLFDEPLRTRRSMVARGSHLAHAPTLRELLTGWVRPEMRPELAVVLVDRDGDHDRRIRLLACVSDVPVRTVIGVACEEFEAWLISDLRAVRKAAGLDEFEAPESPETMPRGEAKRLLDKVLSHDNPGLPAIQGRRRTIAGICDLDVLSNRCPSFAQLLIDLATIL